MLTTMSVAERVAAIQGLLNSFGIPVAPNSSLDLAIRAEFGRGKRSKLTPLLLELSLESDASKLARCIGAELARDTNDPEVLAVAKLLQDRIPPLLEILDIRQSTAKREQQLSTLLSHIASKVPRTPESERMLRMLAAAQKNLTTNVQLGTVAALAENVGLTYQIRDLQRFGKALQGLAPALIALDQVDYPLEQKLNHCMLGFKVLATELHSENLSNWANILDDVHWIAKLSLPKLTSQATVEQGLQQLGISLGTVSMRQIAVKAKQSGLTQQEILQIIYAAADPGKLMPNDSQLLTSTQRNQQYAAICGYVAKLGQELEQDAISKISIVGVCLASLRQTYCELRTNNLNASNFSESLGTILQGAGIVTNNPMLMQVGNSIIAGVQTFASLAPIIPGGVAVAVPLAVCSVLGKLFLKPSKNQEQVMQTEQVLAHLMQEVLSLQQQMRSEFNNVYKELDGMQLKLLIAMDQGFSNLAYMLQHQSFFAIQQIRTLEAKLDSLQLQISQEFSDLYLEYVRSPLEEIAFATRYGEIDQVKIQKEKHKLAMWLIYKAKHPKLNGANFAMENIAGACNKLQHGAEALALVNRYVNARFSQHLPEELPHIQTWLLAANAYVVAANVTTPAASEEQLLADIIESGQQVLGFAQDLAANAELWHELHGAVQHVQSIIIARWQYLQDESNKDLNPCPIARVAQSNATKQLEPFTIANVDISKIWDEHLKKYIPEDLAYAVDQGLGKWHVNFTVDKDVNKFADVHIAYGNNILPDAARDVLFKLEILYVPNKRDPVLVATSWLAYDLYDSRRRFDEYYINKFKPGLPHTRYHWISLDGRTNQVEGHGNTATHKPIDYERLGQVYMQWLQKAEPINKPEILARVKQNPAFMQQNSDLVLSGSHAIVHKEQAISLSISVAEDLRDQILKQRITFASLLQQDPILKTAISKLDVLYAILVVYMRILNVPFYNADIGAKFNELLNMLPQSEVLDLPIIQQFDALIKTPCAVPLPQDEYLNGEFYQKMQTALARLKLLHATVTADRLRLCA